MKNLFLLSLTAFAFLGCSCARNIRDMTYRYDDLTIKGSDFKVTQAPIFTNAVESSIVPYKGDFVYLPAIAPLSGNVSMGNSQDSLVTISSTSKFSYIMEYQGLYYNFFLNNNNIYLSRSSDLFNWSVMNGGAPVLTGTPETDFAILWNPGVAVDDQGVFHLLVECAKHGDQSDVGLCYATATLQGTSLNFDANKASSQVLPGGGNPWIGFVPGKGLLAVYGKAMNPIGTFGNEWYITAAVFKNGAWVENTNFLIGAPGIHVCDPALQETPEGTTMLISYDQHSIYELKTAETLSDLYDRVNK